MKTSFEFSDNVLGVILENKFDSENLQRIQKMLQEKIERFEKIRVYLEDRNSNGITLKAVFRDLAFEMKNKKSLQKIAVVTDAKFFQVVTEMKEILVDTEVETFDRENRIKAMNWVME